jgi:hypothetical protein
VTLVVEKKMENNRKGSVDRVCFDSKSQKRKHEIIYVRSA